MYLAVSFYSIAFIANPFFYSSERVSINQPKQNP